LFYTQRIELLEAPPDHRRSLDPKHNAHGSRYCSLCIHTFCQQDDSGSSRKTNKLLRISKKIKNGSTLSLDKDLLPDFAKQRVANHTIFRGPNCFHAALAFQSPKLASSQFVNVRREKGYHNDMINYDELWRVLQRSFYEVDPLKSDMQYGDMIVFFETKDSNSGAVDFKTLRHAATYLLGGYVFAKGSKSANSPYLVRTLGEEWDTWTKYTKRLGVKVFRRNLKHVTNAVPADPIDWVY